MNETLQGMWTAEIGDGCHYEMQLPGTLDENRIGFPDEGSNQWHPDTGLAEGMWECGGSIATRLTRRCTFEGVVRFSRKLPEELWEKMRKIIHRGGRIFLEAERARVLRLQVDGREVPLWREPSISTPYVFELTEYLKKGSILTLISDNRYPGLPRDSILYSSAATDETQTNWNGILGYLRLRTEEAAFLERIRVYPENGKVCVKVNLCVRLPWRGEICVYGDELREKTVCEVYAEPGVTELVFDQLSLREETPLWDLEEGHLCRLSVSLTGGETKSVEFGVREFGEDQKGHFAINGRRIFLRGETNCAVFPETGYSPMEESAWEKILLQYRSYGVNCVRFHSHCPPEAAFAAADRLGMLMQPELSHWNPKDAFESEEDEHGYRIELLAVLEMLANHPSFVMLTFGNELHASEKGHQVMRGLLRLARRIDPTRLYADGSNSHYGEIGCETEADFYTSSDDWRLHGQSAGFHMAEAV